MQTGNQKHGESQWGVKIGLVDSYESIEPKARRIFKSLAAWGLRGCDATGDG
ncbi:hypothetical protein SESBI_37130 [Sesbania bispinosa]|nr:hypothetical protein SESBI_37130 [Sesbania bispinosa]